MHLLEIRVSAKRVFVATDPKHRCLQESEGLISDLLLARAHRWRQHVLYIGR